jgi:hypothetical protein
MRTILQEKWDAIKDKALVSGVGDLEKGLCIMQAVDYISSGGTKDHPECACQILTEYCIRINDRFTDEDRQKLKPLIPMLVGTRVDEDAIKIARKRVIMWRNVTVTYPALLDLIKADKHAADLRQFENTPDGMKKASEYLKKNREAIRKIAYANANANADADANANADAYANAYADANANADAYANAYADAYAYAYADADAYADAYANAYAYAFKSLRSTIADIAVETLRLAIEVKL